MVCVGVRACVCGAQTDLSSVCFRDCTWLTFKPEDAILTNVRVFISGEGNVLGSCSIHPFRKERLTATHTVRQVHLWASSGSALRGSRSSHEEQTPARVVIGSVGAALHSEGHKPPKLKLCASAVHHGHFL